VNAAVDTDPQLAEALAACRRITRRRARNFYYGLKLAPEPKRSAMYAIYAWMRAADDLVDGAVGGSGDLESRLEEFEEHTRRALDGEPARPEHDHFLWRALRSVAAEFHVRTESFLSALQGQRDDLDHHEYATFNELRDYCYRVASTVGLLCIDIWGYRDDAAREHAINRGIAFQLTNILRDYGEDYDAGRVYLPVEDFHRHGVTPQQVRTWSEPARCGRFWAEQVARTRSYYERSRALEDLIEPDCHAVLWAMTEIYRSLLEKIAADPHRAVAGRRVRVGALQKSRIALEARRRQRERVERAS